MRRPRTVPIAISMLLLALLSPAVAGAQHDSMSITGLGTFDVLAYLEGNSVTPALPTNPRGDEFRELRFIKEIDPHSPLLWGALMSGTIFPSAPLTITDPATSTTALTIQLTTVLVVELSTSVDTEGDGPTRELVRLEFASASYPP